MKILFDTHCHLYDERYNDYKEELIREIRESDLKYLVDIGTDIKTCKKVDANTKRYDFCYGTVGYYPGDTGDLSEEILQELMRLYRENPKIVAMGEIGLDYHYLKADPEYPSKECQRKWFRHQLRAAVELDAPVCIHSRDADGDVFNILREEAFGKIPVLLHCFSGSAELARQYVKLGAFISIAGPVTYKNARQVTEVAATVDLNNLVIETDAPYLTPVPHRGKINKPTYVEFTARKIADIRGMSYEELGTATLANACSFYRIKD